MSVPPDGQSPELLTLFFESATEILLGMNEAGLALEKRPVDAEHLRHVRRLVHTLKGDSAACGFRELSELAHQLEDVLAPDLALVKEGARQVAEAVLIAADTFGEMLDAYRNRVQPPDGAALQECIKQVLGESTRPQPRSSHETNRDWTEYERLLIDAACQHGEAVYHVTMHLNEKLLVPAAAFELARRALDSAGEIVVLRPQGDAPLESIRIIDAILSSSQPAERIRRQCQVPLIVNEVSLKAIAPSQPLDAPKSPPVAEQGPASAVVKQGSADSKREREEAKISVGLPDMVHGLAEGTLRVESERIDTVMNQVGELIIGKSMLQRAVAEFERRYSKDPLRAKLSDALAFQSRVLGELQKSVMKIRMVPIDQLFRRFPRVVRDVARQCNKEVQLEISGQATDLDKRILDSLAEPLAHLIRNAVDHGIEPAAEREMAEKPPCGTIRLKAYHDGDGVVVEVSDDGRGLDRDKIVERAVEQGILTRDEAEELGESEALHLIFEQGLSTAREVTELSGRGVGLDIVRSVLAGLKGSADVSSETGRGTTFRLLVPLTLASIQAVLFRANGRLYALPMASVVEIERVATEDIHRVENREVFQLRKQVLTLVRLDQFARPAAGEQAKRIFVIIIGGGNVRFGLAVDGLIGEEELVIKALEDPLVSSPLVSGASILGDGTVVLILNVAMLISRYSKQLAPGAAA